MDEKVEKVKTVVTAPSPSKREIEIEVSPEEATQEFDKVLADFASRAKLDGFRVGHAPRDMVKRLFLGDIREAVIESIAPRVLRESLGAENIHPIGAPMIRDVRFKEGEALKFRAMVEIIPEFDIPPYQDLVFKKPDLRVEEADVDRALEDLRQKSADYAPVEDRGVADGDYVVIEWKGKDLKTKRFLPTEKNLVLAGHPENEKSLNENLLGAKIQEVRQFVISYPPEHAQKKLAGRDIEYELKVISVKEKKVPEMTDDWAKDLGDTDSLAGLRARVRQEMEKAREESSRHELGEEAVLRLVGALDLELPESPVEAEADALLRSWAPSLRGDLTAPQIEELRQRAKDQARQNIKRGLLLRKIAERERLTVTDEEVEQEIREMAKRNNVPLAQLVARINEEGKREDIRTALFTRKTIDFLLKNAVSYE